jgi:hypothetical protein
MTWVFPKSAMFAFATRRLSDRGGRRGGPARHGPRLIRRAVAQHRVEEARQTAGQRDDGNLFPRRAAMPVAQRRSAAVRGSRRRRIDTAS